MLRFVNISRLLDDHDEEEIVQPFDAEFLEATRIQKVEKLMRIGNS